MAAAAEVAWRKVRRDDERRVELAGIACNRARRERRGGRRDDPSYRGGAAVFKRQKNNDLLIFPKTGQRLVRLFAAG